MKTLSFTNIRVGRDRKKVLIDIDSGRDRIEFKPGLNVLIAPNGWGKSTLLQTIAGYLSPLGGEIKYGDRLLIPERDVLYVSEYLSFPKYIYPPEWIQFIAGKVDQKLRLEAAKRCRINDQLKRFLGQLSQGERRKVTWVAAQFSKRPILMLDEPFEGLDVLATEAARDAIKEWKNQGRIALLVTHKFWSVQDLVDQAYFIHDHRLKRWDQLVSDLSFESKWPDIHNKIVELYS